nr:hypothetical protein OG999_25810 [Streptomyces sp. NBC_00886]
MVGTRIATEASARGHQVPAVSRSGRSPVPGVTTTAADAADQEKAAGPACGADAVSSACVPPRDGTDGVTRGTRRHQRLPPAQDPCHRRRFGRSAHR